MKPSDHLHAERRATLSGTPAGTSLLRRMLPILGLTVVGGLGLGLCLVGPPAAVDAPKTARQIQAAPAMPAALWSAFVRDRQAEAGSAYDFVADDFVANDFVTDSRATASLRSHSVEMGLVAQADHGGVRLFSAEASGPGAGLALIREGCAESPRSAAAVAPQATANRVEYRRDGITEWYVSGPLGLEQGFTVARELGCQRELIFEMQIEKSVRAELTDHGTVVAMHAGGRTYRYGELYAYDADGRELPSTMTLDGQRLRLSVNAAGARYPVVVDPRIYTAQYTLRASDGAINDTYGFAVALSGETALISAPNRNTARGAVYVYLRSGLKWAEQAKLAPSDPASFDNFGLAVAIDGDTVVVGAPYKGTQRGQAYVFGRAGVKWTQQAKLAATDGVSGDYFGNAVAVSGDTVVVGLSSTARNLAIVYKRTGTMWAEQAKLTPSDGKAGDRFGQTVALDTDTAIVGAAEKAYVFVRAGTMWTQQVKLTASDGVAGDKFGAALSLSGETALIGALNKTVGNNAGQGVAYAYLRSGTTWSEQAKLAASDGAAQDQFGAAVALTKDTAVIGAQRAQVGDAPRQGAAYVFLRSGTAWSQYAKLTSADGESDDYFGSAVAVGTSGNTVLVGAHYKVIGQNPAQGQAYVYGLEAQPEGSDCLTGSDCESGSCTNSLCDPIVEDNPDMGDGGATASAQAALIGNGFLAGGGCSLSTSHSAPVGMAGGLFAVLAIWLLRQRRRERE